MDEKKIYNLVGKVLEEDLISTGGAVLLPRGTEVTISHVNKVLNHNLYAPPRAKNSNIPQVIEGAISELDSIFAYTRKKNVVPIKQVYRDVLPTIMKVTSYPFVSDLLASLGTTDDYTVTHSLAVSMLSTMLGRWLGLNEEQLVDLSISSTLHDIGKVKIPIEILNKPSKLSPEEFIFMKKHTIFGYEMIRATEGTKLEQALAALEHHERLDGRGYPFGIGKDRISYFAKIVAIADVFHAMGSSRVYHGPKPTYQILSEMWNGVFGAHDPKILQIFLRRYMENLIGARVLLSSGKKATIRLIHPEAPMHPLLETEDGFIDLNQHFDIQIEQVLS